MRAVLRRFLAVSCLFSPACVEERMPTRPTPTFDIVSTTTCPSPSAAFALSPLETGVAFLTPPAFVNLDDGVNIKVAQRISGIGGALGRITFRVSMSGPGAFGGDRVVVTLQTDDAGKPSGMVLASTDAGEQVGTTTKGGFFPVGTSQVAPRPDLFIPPESDWDGTLDPSASYWLVFERKDATTSAYYLLGADNSNPYTGGQVAVLNGNTWNATTFPSFDLILELKGSLCISQNRLPTADAGPDQVIAGLIDVNDPSQFPPRIILNGSGSHDPDAGDQLSYMWTVGQTVLGDGPTPDVTGQLGPGVHTVTLTVDDGRGEISQDEVSVTVSPLLVLVHGATSNPDSAFGGFSSTSFARLFEDEFSVVFFDYRTLTECSGLRPPPVTQVAEAFGGFTEVTLLGKAPRYTGQIYLLAHSMGGLVIRAYMAGLTSRSYTRGTFGRLVTVGSPHYGFGRTWWLNAKACRTIGKAPQFQDLEFGSSFVWDLHKAWTSGILPPIDASDVLTIGGVYDRLGQRYEWDGGVEVASAMLPTGLSTSAYNECAHSDTDIWPLRKCVLVNTKCTGLNCDLGLTGTNHPTYRAARQFLKDRTVPAPYNAPPGLQRLGRGLQLIEFVVTTTGGQVPLLGQDEDGVGLDIQFGIGSTKLDCGDTGGLFGEMQCPAVDSRGIVSVNSLVRGGFVLSSVKTKGFVLDPAPVMGTVPEGRPSVRRLTFMPK